MTEERGRQAGGEEEREERQQAREGPEPQDTRDERENYGFASVYMAELLYRDKPVIDREALYARVQKYTGEIGGAGEDTERLAVWEPNSSGDGENGGQEAPLHFFHLSNRVTYAGGEEMPAQTAIMGSERAPKPEDYRTALQQSWHWPQAEQAVTGCSYALMLTDLMASGLPYKDRLRLFAGVLRALAETAPCEAIYWRASDKLVEPGAFVQAMEEDQLLYGALNIRLFRERPNEEGRVEMVMDSVGLAALGVPDVQCHFYDMNPNETAGFLLDIAHYLFNRGDIIADGETIGRDEQQRWLCEHQYSLLEPRRVVLDLNPGPEYYAGR